LRFKVGAAAETRREWEKPSIKEIDVGMNPVDMRSASCIGIY
jgi:hypothetical protein